jgi:hypothetical protein
MKASCRSQKSKQNQDLKTSPQAPSHPKKKSNLRLLSLPSKTILAQSKKKM